MNFGILTVQKSVVLVSAFGCVGTEQIGFLNFITGCGCLEVDIVPD
jgi:hypothetical protein